MTYPRFNCLITFMLVVLGTVNTFAQSSKPEPMIPIYKDPPYYPRSAAEQGIEGWVYATFDVLEDGTVEKSSITILDEEPEGVFTRPAIQSTESLIFNPRLSANGIPVRAKGITYLFHFALRSKATNGHYSDDYKGRPPPSID